MQVYLRALDALMNSCAVLNSQGKGKKSSRSQASKGFLCQGCTAYILITTIVSSLSSSVTSMTVIHIFRLSNIKSDSERLAIGQLDTSMPGEAITSCHTNLTATVVLDWG